MRIGILGGGRIGGTLARKWASAGHEVVLASRHPESLAPLVAELGPRARAGTPLDAASVGEVVLLALPFAAVGELGPDVVGALAGKVVLDAGNPFPQRDGVAAREALDGPGGSGVWTAARLPGARLVKAFNTVHFQTLARTGDPVGVPVAGDDPEAVEVAVTLVADAGHAPVVVGPLKAAAAFEPGTPVWNGNLRAEDLRRALAPDRGDAVASGPDAATLADALRWPALGQGRFGWRALLRPAAALRALKARQVANRLRLEVSIDAPV